MCSLDVLLLPDDLCPLEAQVEPDGQDEPDGQYDHSQDGHTHYTVHQYHVPLRPQEEISYMGGEREQ